MLPKDRAAANNKRQISRRKSEEGRYPIMIKNNNGDKTDQLKNVSSSAPSTTSPASSAAAINNTEFERKPSLEKTVDENTKTIENLELNNNKNEEDGNEKDIKDEQADFDNVSVSDVTCAICMEIFEQPKELECGHAFCLECVYQIKLQQQKTDQQNRERNNNISMFFETRHNSVSSIDEDDVGVGQGEGDEEEETGEVVYDPVDQAVSSIETRLIKKGGRGKITCPICRVETKLPHSGIKGLGCGQGLKDALVVLGAKVVADTPKCHRHDSELNAVCMTCQDRVCAQCPKTSHSSHTTVTYEELEKLDSHIKQRCIEMKTQSEQVCENVSAITQTLVNALRQREENLIDDVHMRANIEIDLLKQEGERLMNMIHGRNVRVRNSVINQAQKTANMRVMVDVDTADGLNRMDWGRVVSSRQYDNTSLTQIVHAVQPRCIGKVSGGGECKYVKPIAVILDQQRQRLFVADKVGFRIFVYDYSYFALPFICSLQCDNYSPLSMAVDEQRGYLYVCGRTREGFFSASKLRVFVYSTHTNTLPLIFHFDVHGAGICIDSLRRRLYVSDSEGKKVKIYSLGDKTTLLQNYEVPDNKRTAVIPSNLRSNTPLNIATNGESREMKPGNVPESSSAGASVSLRQEDRQYDDTSCVNNVVIHENKLFISDVNGGLIQVYDMSDDDCKFVATLRDSNEGFAPLGMSLHNDRTLFVTDVSTHKVKVFDVSSCWQKRTSSMESYTVSTMCVSEFGSEGNGSFNFNLPCAISVDKSGVRIFVVDAENSRVCVWETH